MNSQPRHKAGLFLSAPVAEKCNVYRATVTWSLAPNGTHSPGPLNLMRSIIPDGQSAKWNVKRGLIRVWVLFATIWLATAGGIWVAEWSDEILWFGREFVALFRPAADYSAADYEALCATLRRQRAGGGPVDKIPVIPVAEVTVNNGVGRVVAARGRCLVVFAQEEGVDW